MQSRLIGTRNPGMYRYVTHLLDHTNHISLGNFDKDSEYKISLIVMATFLFIRRKIVFNS